MKKQIYNEFEQKEIIYYLDNEKFIERPTKINNIWSSRMKKKINEELKNIKRKSNIKTTKNSSQHKQRPTTSGHEKWKTTR